MFNLCTYAKYCLKKKNQYLHNFNKNNTIICIKRQNLCDSFVILMSLIPPIMIIMNEKMSEWVKPYQIQRNT